MHTDLIAVMDSRELALFEKDAERVLPHIAFYLASGAPRCFPAEILQKTRLVEIEDDPDVKDRIKRAQTDPSGNRRCRAGGTDGRRDAAGHRAWPDGEVEVIHVVADLNGRQIGA